MTRRFLRTLAAPVSLILPWLLWPVASRAEVACSPIFSDHMVLQRNRPIVVRGTAQPGEDVSVQFADHSAHRAAGPDGTWQIELPALGPSLEPRSLVVTGDNTLTFSDVLVGDVWVCSGQSNMVKPLVPYPSQYAIENWTSTLAHAELPNLRLFQVPHDGVPRISAFGGHWLACSPTTLGGSDFSAVGYFFGQTLVERHKVPVGLVEAAVGGSPLSSWMPPGADPQNGGGGAYFDGLLYALHDFPVRGFLWYQGESDCLTGLSGSYALGLTRLINGWRGLWKEPDAPFYIVQIAPFSYSTFPSSTVTAQSLPLLWEAEAQVGASVPGAAVVPILDLPVDLKDMHPTAKRVVGLRLAQLALGLDGPPAGSGRPDGDVDSRRRAPSFLSYSLADDGTATVRFRDVRDGLVSRDRRRLRDFSLAGPDHVFHQAEAEVAGPDSVRVYSPDVPHPAAIRFGWVETATPNLSDLGGWPVYPFRTDTWPVRVSKLASAAGK